MRNSEHPNIAQLLEMSPAELARQDIAAVNLACAVGLPGSEGLNIPACLQRLDQWADHVQYATELAFKNKPKFPEYHDWSDARYRAMMILISLQNHLGMNYDFDRIKQEYDGRDSRDLFIHAVVMDDYPAACTAAPVIYAAIARRLGYPVRIVKTKCHVFLPLGRSKRRTLQHRSDKPRLLHAL